MGSHDRNTPNVVSQVHTQLSFARGDDAYYDEIIDDAGNINQHSFPVVGDPVKYIRCFLRVPREKKIAILPILVLTLFVTFLPPLLRKDGSRNSNVENKRDANSGNGISPSPSSMTCPIQSSYFVSSEIMGLKNSSTVENNFQGSVATDHPICSEIGVSILRDSRGNAADAAVASALCLGVVNPTSSGLGGGAFILMHSDDRDMDEATMPSFVDARSNHSKTRETIHRSRIPQKITEFIDCRETAPKNATYDMFESLPPEVSTLGGLAIAVPGELRGLELLHHRHGALPWEEVVKPALELARDGFPVGPHLAEGIQRNENYIKSLPDLGHILTKENDGVTLLKEGDIMKQTQLAKTLDAIMHGGADALYTGDIAKILAHDIKSAGRVISLEDISNYQPVLRDPLVSRNIDGYTVVGAPPPSSGGAVIMGALRFLSSYTTPLSAFVDTLSKHWYVEACAHAFAIRMSLSDPKFYPKENSDAVADLISNGYMESLRKNTSDDSVLSLSQYGGVKWAQLKDSDDTENLVDAQEGDRRRRVESNKQRKLRDFNYLDDHGTTSLSVVDKDRNAVTITSSINLEFGSKVASPSTGIILNNQMDDFATPGMDDFFGLRPSESNYIASGKRPLSSMSPTMVFRSFDGNESGIKSDDLGKLVLNLGASGGPKIITSVLQTILNYAYLGMPLYESVSAPRIHNQLLYHGAAGLNIEQDTLSQGPLVEVSQRTRMALEKRGHKVIPSDFLGAVQAVAIDLETDALTAVSDIRKQGMPAGY